VKMDRFHFRAMPAPLHGEHTREILAEAAVDESELAELAREGVI